MNYRTFGRLAWPVSEVGYGLWGIGGWTGSNDDESIAAIERAIDLGCTFFDTALAYGDGRSERLLGRVLANHRSEDLKIATKIPPKNGRWPALPEYPLNDVFPADHIRASTETSLENLGLQSIDLQQLHVWTDAWALEDGWQRAVADLKREGLIKGFGISLNRWEPDSAFNAIATGLIDSVQVVYNIFDQNPEDELFPRCRELNIAVIARVPFDEGSLSGSVRRGMTWPEGDWRNLYFTRDKLNATMDRVDMLAKDLPAGATMAESALKFILAHPDVSTVIPGMRKALHVNENMAVSGAAPLTAEELARLRPHRWKRTYVVT